MIVDNSHAHVMREIDGEGCLGHRQTEHKIYVSVINLQSKLIFYKKEFKGLAVIEQQLVVSP